MKRELAINGWKKTRDIPFEPQPGPHIRYTDTAPDGSPVYLNAVKRVLGSEILSGYRGNATQAFWGGQNVKRFEKDIEEKFGAAHAIACNSATSGLWMACAAIDLQPGDEVIVTPWSMSCSATVPLLFGAVPIFADIDADTYCLSFEDVKEKITPATKAIIAVDLFGFTFDERISELASELGIFVIEDSAQAIGSKRNGVYAGLLGDIGVYSFTQGKHLTAGEGGCCVTNNSLLAAKLALVRNHAEAVTSDAAYKESSMLNSIVDASLVGLNLRMTEIQAAILSVELKELDKRIYSRNKNSERIISRFNRYFKVREIPLHNSLYCLPLRFDDKNVNTKYIVDAIAAELVGDRVRLDRGVPISNGYIRPLSSPTQIVPIVDT